MIRFLAVLAAALVFWTPGASAQEGAWVRAESEHFIVYGRGRERPVREAAELLERFDALLQRLTRSTEPEHSAKLPIYLLEDHRALRRVWPSARASVAGFYSAQPEFVGAFAIQNEDGWQGAAQQVLFHEYTHHFMLHHFPHAYPRWYVEGFAEYMSTVEFERDRVLVGRPSTMRGATLLYDDFLPLNSLLAPPERMSGADVGMFYAQSWLFTHYLFSSQERQARGRAYLAAIASGNDPIEAFDPAFGETPAAFERTLRSYMTGSLAYISYPAGRAEEVAVAVTRLPRSADLLLLLNARLQRNDTEEAERAAAAEVLEEAQRFPGDAFAARSGAYAEIERSTESARAMLTPVLAANSDDVEALYLMGRTYFADADAEGADRESSISAARRFFVRAFRADPEHVPTLYYYVRTFDGQRLPAQALDVLIQAHLLAPQVSEIRLNTAVQLMNAARFEEAAEVIRPLIYSPHDQASARRARVFYEAARRGEMASPDALSAAEGESGGDDGG